MRQKVNGRETAVELQNQPDPSNVFTVEHYLSRLQRDQNYQRRVTVLHHKKSVALVEYLGNFPEHVSCHGNSKSGGEYVRTAPQVMAKIAAACSNSKPKTVYTTMVTEDNDTDKPRNLKQVQNVTAKNTQAHAQESGTRSSPNFADEIQTLISEVTSNEFVQAVFVTKGHTPSIVLYIPDQITDLKRFCVNSAPQNLRSILAVDRTFNLASLFVTVTVFKHRAVLRRTTNDHPIFLGPILLHGDGTYATYRQFFSHVHDTLDNDVSSTELRMEECVLTGSDEEHAMVKALKYAFPVSQHMFCMIHCKDNVRHYMTKIGVALDHREKILAMLFGTNGATLSGDEIQLENKLAEIMQYIRMSNLGDDLQNYVQQKAFPKITNNLNIMWTEKWLGQYAWNNNNSESINHVLKLAVEWKPQRVTDLVAHLRDVVRAQYADLKRALYGQGEFHMTPHFQSHVIANCRWGCMSEKRQEEAFSAFMRDTGVRKKTNTVLSSDSRLTVQGNSRIARKPGQRTRATACRSQPKACQ